MPLTRPELGPTLPEAVQRRFGVPAAVTLIVGALVSVAAVAAVTVLLTRPNIWGERVLHEGRPVFNMIYQGEAIREAPARAGELVRLEGRRAGLEAAVVVRPLELPPFDGDVAHGLLPVHADGFVEAAKRRMPGTELVQEGRGRVNNAVGYEVAYERVTDAERLTGRDVLLVPDDPAEGGRPVVISLRLRKGSGEKLTPPERNLAFHARKAYRSFRYGTDRA